MKRKTIKQHLECRLTDAEKIERGAASATLTLEIGELELAKKSAADDFKARIDGKALEVKSIARTLKQGFEIREVGCEEQKDYQARTVTIIRLDTGEIVSSRGMTIEEMQEPFGFAEEAEFEESEARPQPEEMRIVRLGND